MTLEEWESATFLADWRAHKAETVGIWTIPTSFKTVFAQMSLFYRSTNTPAMFNDENLDRMFAELQQAVDLEQRDQIQREMGNYLYDEYTQLLLVYIVIEFVANPDIIDQWPFLGSDGANYGHPDYGLHRSGAVFQLDPL